jgi:hypothetical protein
MSKKYKIMFHAGSDLNLKTRGFKGEAWIDQSGLNIQGPMGEIFVKRQDIQRTELLRVHGLGRVIRIEKRSGNLLVSVDRLKAGPFALINFLRTGRLHRELIGLVSNP